MSGGAKARALIFVALSAAAWSTGGLFVRLLAMDIWVIAFWRGVLGAAFIAGYLVLRRNEHPLAAFRTLGGRAWWIIGSAAISMLAFMAALPLTSVANIAVIHAATPIIVAALARLVLGESFGVRAALAGLGAMIGAAILVGGTGMGRGLIGDGLALLMTLTMAITTLSVRRHQQLSLLPLLCAANLLVAIVSGWAASGALAISSAQLGLLNLFAFVQIGLGYILFSLGARWLPASRTALIGAIDAPLAPFWVWLALNETPSLSASLGGAVILISVIGYLATDRQADDRLESPAQDRATKSHPRRSPLP